jgi:hypothetical protein
VGIPAIGRRRGAFTTLIDRRKETERGTSFAEPAPWRHQAGQAARVIPA